MTGVPDAVPGSLEEGGQRARVRADMTPEAEVEVRWGHEPGQASSIWELEEARKF